MAQEELIFGLHAVTAALKYEPEKLSEIWVEVNRRDGRMRDLLDGATRHSIAIHRKTRSELDRMTSGGRHQGVVARRIGLAQVLSEDDLPGIVASVQGPPLLVMLDGVQDPHNLGACLRSADAAGAHALIVPADRAVSLTPTVRKVACGAAEIVPFVQVTNLARTLRSLQEQGLWVIGAAGEAGINLYEVDLTAPVVIVLGAEEKGLRRLTREVCDTLAKIPMAGSVESLNVSVAAGIFLFEAVRQRQVAKRES